MRDPNAEPHHQTALDYIETARAPHVEEGRAQTNATIAVAHALLAVEETLHGILSALGAIHDHLERPQISAVHEDPDAYGRVTAYANSGSAQPLECRCYRLMDPHTLVTVDDATKCPVHGER